jgi:hypothetical protein
MLEWLPWTDAAVIAAGCGGTTAALRHRVRGKLRVVATWTRELTLMFCLYGLWQLAGDLSVHGVAGAIGRGRRVWRVERWLHLPSEAGLQRTVLPHRELVHLLNIYYAEAHVPALGVALVWLFVRHRDRYPAVRNVLVAVTAASLLIQLLPVAPPRLVPGLGVVDTGRLIGPSTYPATVKPGLDQLSAMPSLHVGWALIVAGSIIWSLRSRWRWLALLYPAVTWWIVLVTGNHYWLDGAVSLLLVALATGTVGLIGRRAPRQVAVVAASVVTPSGRSRLTVGRGDPGRDLGSDEAADERRAPAGRTGEGGQVGRPLGHEVPREGEGGGPRADHRARLAGRCAAGAAAPAAIDDDSADRVRNGIEGGPH